jgi:hypothetical protein
LLERLAAQPIALLYTGLTAETLLLSISADGGHVIDGVQIVKTAAAAADAGMAHAVRRRCKQL